MTPRFSVVTISYNQDAFLPAAMESVLSQTDAEIEYILCDPGSSDTSRAIIEANPDPRIVRVFESDDGPADGLNKGFSQATGDIYYYLNSDDLVLPGAFGHAARYFAGHPEVDVLCGHAEVIDETGQRIRRVWSDPFQRYAVATGAHIQIQPATFIRADAYRRAGGFDASDRGNWDGGLLTSLFLSGARIEVIDAVLGAYRLHADSITMSGQLTERHSANALRNFERLMGRTWDWRDDLGSRALRLAKHLRHPARTFERLQKGPLFKAG